MKKFGLAIATLCLSTLMLAQTSQTLSSPNPLWFTSTGTGTYNKTALYHSYTYGYKLELARTSDLLSANPINFQITARGNGYSPFFIQGSTGNVGIGTTSPAYSLQIHNSNNPTLAIGQQATNTGGKSTLRFFANDGSVGNAFRIEYNKTTAPTDRLSFIDGGAIEVLTLSNGGNVGIGTTSPNARFEIKGDFIRLQEKLAGRTLDIYPAVSGQNHRFTSTTTGGGYNFENNVGTLMTIDNSGMVGIGTNPSQKLSVAGHAIFEAENPTIKFSDASGSTYEAQFRFQDNIMKYMWGGGVKHAFETNALVIGDYLNGENEVKISRSSNSWLNGGNVGIGTTSPTEKLSVNGNILAKRVRVSIAVADWPDYVFDPNYELRSLSELEAFIQTNHHLPEVPSAKEVDTNGLDLGNMDATLLKKVEELTLYTIDQQKKIDQQAKENQELKDRLSKIESLLKTLTSK